MRTILGITILVAGLASASLSPAALAKGNAGGGSSHSAMNGNGKNAVDRDKGLARAADRRNGRSIKNRSGKHKAHTQKSVSR
ncbi:hypothetical protein [Herbaspirillum sp.]|uniref:hypothetical protein n=1 Tax=Herbaspirillum sp. TaxID=1890675 RepID=UPI001B1147E3|nr:hypothetical protein [Herbaspirillum sp.]MBO9537285.1 hypothetical protein [Herbaspirillum sp.]